MVEKAARKFDPKVFLVSVDGGRTKATYQKGRLIGTTRSRVSFFMNKFRDLGLIEYNGDLRIHTSLLDVVLHEGAPRIKTR